MTQITIDLAKAEYKANIPGLMTLEEMKQHEWIVSWSGGKDSTATIFKMLEHNVPIKKIVYVRMMLDKDLPATLPIMCDFVNKMAERFRNMGIDVEIIETPYLVELTKKVRKKAKTEELNEKPYGYCAFFRGFCKGTDAKQKTIKSLKLDNQYQMIGIASDEQNRFHSLSSTKQSILATLGISEQDCYDICCNYNALSPLYSLGFTRDGCWFCPNANKQERKYLKENYPHLVDKIIEMCKITPAEAHKIASARNNWFREYLEGKLNATTN